MRVLVTGANGYVGRAVVAALYAAGHEPVAMVRAQLAAIPHVSDVRTADLHDGEALRRAVDGADAVCHLAGVTRARESLEEPLKYLRVNTCGTVALLEAMAATGVSRLVFASTGSIYGTPEHQPMSEDLPDSPPHPYASSKLAAELGIGAQSRSGELAAIVIRMFNIAGGADPDSTRLVPRALAAAGGHSTLAVNGDGAAVRDYLHIDDAAAAFVASIDHFPPIGTSRRYNVGSGRGTSVLDVIAAVERVTGSRVRLEHRAHANEPAILISDPSRAMAELDWVPRNSDIDEIIRDAWSATRGV